MVLWCLFAFRAGKEMTHDFDTGELTDVLSDSYDLRRECPSIGLERLRSSVQVKKFLLTPVHRLAYQVPSLYFKAHLVFQVPMLVFQVLNTHFKSYISYFESHVCISSTLLAFQVPF